MEELVKKPVPDGVYICCFCAKDNLLSQWRGYAANGVGVSIELKHEEFEYLTGPDCPHGLLRLWKVFYKKEQQRHIIAKALEFAWTQRMRLPMGKCVQNAADAIQFFVPTFKDSDFEEENEWRPNLYAATECSRPSGIPPSAQRAGAVLHLAKIGMASDAAVADHRALHRAEHE